MQQERTRTRADSAPGNGWTLKSYQMFLDGTWSSITTYTGVDDPYFKNETITDVICWVDAEGLTSEEFKAAKKGCCKELQKLIFKPLTHSKTMFTPAAPLPVEVDFLFNNDTERKRWSGTLYGGANEFVEFNNRMALDETGIVSQSKLAEAIRDLKPSVEKFFPNVNIYEILGDLGKMKQLLHAFTADHRVGLSKSFAQKHLEYNFGFKPLLEDLLAIWTIQESIDRIIDVWNDFARKGKIMDFHGFVDNHEANDSWETVNYGYPEDSDIRAFGRKYKYSYQKTSRVHVYIKPHEIPESYKMGIMLKAFGVDKPLAGLWELVPFSWAVDYFVNVGDVIAEFEKGLDDMFQFSVVSAGYSTKTSMIGYSKHYREYGTNRTVLPTEWSEHTLSEYVRVPLPTTLFDTHVVPAELGWAGGPSQKQSSYLLAVGRMAFKR